MILTVDLEFKKIEVNLKIQNIKLIILLQLLRYKLFTLKYNKNINVSMNNYVFMFIYFNIIYYELNLYSLIISKIFEDLIIKFVKLKHIIIKIIDYHVIY